jgi:mRNA interferase MazF
MLKSTGARSVARKSGSQYQPNRGDFAYLDFSPHAGTEQGGRRPALILSPRDYNVATGLVFACPITNQEKSSPFEVAIARGARVTGVVLANQLRAVDWLVRNAEFQGKAPEDLILEVLARIEAILRISVDS